MSKPITVAITGMNAKPDNPGPGLAVARCLVESPDFEGKIVGLSYDPLDPGLYLKDFCDSGYLLPYPSSGDVAFMDRLKTIQEKENINVFIPCLDAELPGIIRLLPQIEAMGIKTFLPTAEELRIRNKDRLPEVADYAGLYCPDITTITSAGFFYDCQEKGWSYPLVVKGLFYDAIIAHNADQAADGFKKIAADWGYPVLVQKFVKGQEYNLTALGDGQGNMLGAVMMKKMALTDKGKAWAGVSIEDEVLYQASEKLIREIKWRGPLEVEVLKDNKGQYQLLEINPRFPAWIYLSHGVNRNLPAALIALALDQPMPEFGPPLPGTMFIRYAQETIVPISAFEEFIVAGMNH